MDLRRVAAIARKSLEQISNDRRTLAFIFLVPLVLIVVFGYGFGGQPNHIAVAVSNLDSGSEGAAILSHLPSGALDLTMVDGSPAAYNAVHSGTAWAAIVISANFSKDLSSGNATLTVYVDGSSPTIVSAVEGAVESAIQSTFGGSAGRVPVSLAPEYVYESASTSFINTLAPGVMALVAVFAATVLSILVLVREKTQGLIERLFASPLRASELVAGHCLSLVVLAVAQSTVLFLAAFFLFQATFVGSIALALGILVLFALGNIGLGMLISAVAQSEFQAVQLIPFIIFPQILFSGALFPLDSIPVSFRPVSEVLPLTYAAHALQSVLLRGWGAFAVGWDLLALTIYAALTLTGAALLVRRQA